MLSVLKIVSIGSSFCPLFLKLSSRGQPYPSCFSLNVDALNLCCPVASCQLLVFRKATTKDQPFSAHFSFADAKVCKNSFIQP